ncbi:MAG: hypothetical protein PVI75_02960 [Gammaproteobacteria bacterium]
MLKHLLVIIALSALVVLTIPYCHIGVHVLINFHHMLLNFLNSIFTNGLIAVFIKQLIALLFIPLAIVFVISGIYWLFTKRRFPYSLVIMWALWTILAVAIVA